MWQMLRRSRINLTLAYLQDLLPGSVLKHQATPLLIQVDLFQATELETEGKGDRRLGRLPQWVGHDWGFI